MVDRLTKRPPVLMPVLVLFSHDAIHPSPWSRVVFFLLSLPVLRLFSSGAQNDKVVGDIKVVAHPSELLLDKAGRTLFVFVSIANKLQVIDTNRREVPSTWPVSSQRLDDAAFDESTSRLFIRTRTPAEMIVMAQSFNLGSSDDGNVYGLIACLTVIVICYLNLLTACAHVAIIASVEATR
jgi:hypothetical protein